MKPNTLAPVLSWPAGLLLASWLALAGCTEPGPGESPGAAAQQGAQEAGQAPDADEPPPEAAAPDPFSLEGPEGIHGGPCVGPDFGYRERLAPTPDACDPHAREGYVTLYEGDAAVEAMRACSFEGAADRRPYTALLIPQALLDAWPADQAALLVNVSAPGVEVYLHRHQEDGASACHDVSMELVGLGEGLFRPGDSIAGSVTLQRRGEGLHAVGMLRIGLTSAGVPGVINQGVGAETLY